MQKLRRKSHQDTELPYLGVLEIRLSETATTSAVISQMQLGL